MIERCHCKEDVYCCGGTMVQWSDLLLQGDFAVAMRVRNQAYGYIYLNVAKIITAFPAQFINISICYIRVLDCLYAEIMH